MNHLNGTAGICPPADRPLIVAVACAGWGLSKEEMASRMGGSYQSLRLWEAGETSIWRNEAKLREMYTSAPAREPVESLGLHLPQNLPVALAALKRKLGLSVKELGDMIGASEVAVQYYFGECRRPNQRYVRRTAELCREHNISSQDIERERRQPARFRKTGQGGRTGNPQMLFIDQNPEIGLRGVIRRAKADIGVKFKDIAAAVGVPETQFFNFTRMDARSPTPEIQSAVFRYLEAAYATAGADFPLSFRDGSTVF